jgi:hypothetical protein
LSESGAKACVTGAVGDENLTIAPNPEGVLGSGAMPQLRQLKCPRCPGTLLTNGDVYVCDQDAGHTFVLAFKEPLPMNGPDIELWEIEIKEKGLPVRLP